MVAVRAGKHVPTARAEGTIGPAGFACRGQAVLVSDVLSSRGGRWRAVTRARRRLCGWHVG
jgi:hypothetical protein